MIIILKMFFKNYSMLSKFLKRHYVLSHNRSIQRTYEWYRSQVKDRPRSPLAYPITSDIAPQWIHRIANEDNWDKAAESHDSYYSPLTATINAIDETRNIPHRILDRDIEQFKAANQISDRKNTFTIYRNLNPRTAASKSLLSLAYSIVIAAKKKAKSSNRSVVEILHSFSVNIGN